MLQAQLLRLAWSKYSYPKVGYLREEKLDIFHSTDHVNIPVPRSCKKIMTIHDLSFLRPELGIRLAATYQKDIERSASEADAIICVSEFTKKDVLANLAKPEKQVHVIYEGVDHNVYTPWSSDPKIDSSVLTSLGLESGYFLYVGKIEARKNLVRLVKAYEMSKRQIKTLPSLILVGKRGNGWKCVEKAIEESSNRSSIRMIGFLQKDVLPILYRNAMAFVYPSLFEGFGLPVVEAMACGTPVIVHNGTSLPEVVNDSGRVIDTTKIESLSQSLIEVYKDPDMRSVLSDASIKRAQQFTWRNAARSTLEVYGKVMYG